MACGETVLAHSLLSCATNQQAVAYAARVEPGFILDRSDVELLPNSRDEKQLGQLAQIGARE